MTQPLALVLYKKLLPGSQLVNRLQDLGYQVQALTDAESLGACAEQERPLLVLADLESTRNNVCAAISNLKKKPATRHLPVIAFAGEAQTELQAAAREAGASLVVSENCLLSQLEPLLDQALQVE